MNYGSTMLAPGEEFIKRQLNAKHVNCMRSCDSEHISSTAGEALPKRGSEKGLLVPVCLIMKH